MSKPQNQKWEYKARPKTVLAKCRSCLQSGHYTITEFPHLWREALLKQTCHKCRQAGTLITSDLAKTKPKKDHGSQLPLDLFPLPKKTP